MFIDIIKTEFIYGRGGFSVKLFDSESDYVLLNNMILFRFQKSFACCIFNWNCFLLQILTLYESLHVVDVNKIVGYVKSLQKEDGSFAGDRWGNNFFKYYMPLDFFTRLQHFTLSFIFPFI